MVVGDVWAAMRDRVGEDLRAVTRYEGSGFETRMREDVREQYTFDDDREVVDQTILRQLSLDDLEAAFDLGSLESQVWVFERAWVVTWPDCLPGKSGLLVSVERGGEATLADVGAAVDYLESEVGPRLE